MKLLASAIVAAGAVLAASPCVAQERTIESAQAFLKIYFSKHPMRSATVRDIAGRDDLQIARQGGDRVIHGADAPERCTTSFRTSSGQTTIRWDEVTTAGMQTWGDAGSGLLDPSFPPIIKMISGGDAEVFWPETNAEAKRLYDAMWFLKKHCDAAEATGF